MTYQEVDYSGYNWARSLSTWFEIAALQWTVYVVSLCPHTGETDEANASAVRI